MNPMPRVAIMFREKICITPPVGVDHGCLGIGSASDVPSSKGARGLIFLATYIVPLAPVSMEWRIFPQWHPWQ
jgi:hypothetical protein